MSIAAQQEVDASIPAPAELRKRVDRLLHKRDDRVTQSRRLAEQFHELNQYLATAEKVTGALEQLSQQLFQQLLGIVEEKLTIALQEILDQPLKFCAHADFKRGAATVEFSICRNGHTEDVLKGQGGSVANILSVGLRMFALATLDPNQHRRFLVLDEQDCWLRPDLVPKLVKIVHEASQALGFQVLMISHHEVGVFEQYADRIYRFTPRGEGSVEVRQVSTSPTEADASD
jgi:DNA repair exonuclease SbcCD ATPase subunit